MRLMTFNTQYITKGHSFCLSDTRESWATSKQFKISK